MSKIELSDFEMSQLIARQHVNFRVFENAFYQFEQELLEPGTWKRYRIIIADLLKNNEASKKMWAMFADSFTGSFRVEVKQLLNKDNIRIDDPSSSPEDSLKMAR